MLALDYKLYIFISEEQTQFMSDEIRQLSKDEYEQLKSAATARRSSKTRIERNAMAMVESQMAVHEEGVEIGQKAWEMRKKGLSLPKIAQELAIPQNVLRECLKQFEALVAMEAGAAMTHFAALDIERIEDMIGYHLPLATAGPITMEKVRDGEIFTEADFDRPMKSSYFVLHSIQMRLKILAAMNGPGTEGAGANTTNIVLWLQAVLPGVTKAVADARPRESELILETQAEQENP
jgi:hypothetical protein